MFFSAGCHHPWDDVLSFERRLVGVSALVLKEIELKFPLC